MDQLLAQANRISKPWLPELYTLLLRVGVLFERNFEFLPLQRTCLDKVLQSILNDIETKQADFITVAQRETLKAVVEHLESSNSFLIKTKY